MQRSATEKLLAPENGDTAITITEPAIALSSPRAELAKMLRDTGWDTLEILAGTATWIVVYYLRPFFEAIDEDHESVGYALHNVLMGLLSNAAASSLMMLRERLRDTKLSVAALKEARNEALKYLSIFVWVDGSYQFFEDWAIASSQSKEIFPDDFEMYAELTFDDNEKLVAIPLIGLTAAFIHYGVSKLANYGWQHYGWSHLAPDETTLLSEWKSIGKSLLVGSQYYVFYLTDYAFDIDMDPVDKGVRNLIASSAIVAGYSAVSSILLDPDFRVWKLLRDCLRPVAPVVEETEDQRSEQDYTALNDHPETTVVVSGSQLSPQSSVRAEDKRESHEQTEPRCWDRIMSRFPFWRKVPQVEVKANSTKTSTPSQQYASGVGGRMI